MSKAKRRELKKAKEFNYCRECGQKAKLTKFRVCIRCAYSTGKIEDPLTEPLLGLGLMGLFNR